MNIKTTAWLLAGLVAAGVSSVRADDLNTVKHPVNALHEHEVSNDKVAIARDNDLLKEKKQQIAQAKKDYRADVKAHGAASDVTKSAQARVDSLEKEFRDLEQKKRDDAHALQKDSHKVSEDKR